MFFFLNFNDLFDKSVPTWRRVYAWISATVMALFAIVAGFFIISALFTAVRGGIGNGLSNSYDATTDTGTIGMTGRSGFFCLPCCLPLPLALFGGGLPFLRRFAGGGDEGDDGMGSDS